MLIFRTQLRWRSEDRPLLLGDYNSNTDNNKHVHYPKLENSYVAILRVVVIVVATLLLVAAAVLATMSLKGMLPATQQKIEVGSVDAKDVLAEVTPAEKPSAVPAPSPQTDSTKANPYLADYEKAYAAVASFVSKTSKKTLELQKSPFYEVLDHNIANYDADEVKAKYISGLASAFVTSLADKRLIARVEKTAPAKPAVDATPEATQAAAQSEGVEQSPAPQPAVEEKPYKESPFVVANEVLTAYNKMFNQKLAEARERQAAAAAEGIEAKVNASTRLYIAAGLFGTFLLVIFLTIAIRIERNIREIAVRA